MLYFNTNSTTVFTLPASFASASETVWPQLLSQEEVAEADNVIVKVVERVSRGAENSERQQQARQHCERFCQLPCKKNESKNQVLWTFSLNKKSRAKFKKKLIFIIILKPITKCALICSVIRQKHGKNVSTLYFLKFFFGGAKQKL